MIRHVPSSAASRAATLGRASAAYGRTPGVHNTRCPTRGLAARPKRRRPRLAAIPEHEVSNGVAHAHDQCP
jgi:hypothetical protein